ncbi:MAG: 50S ribosomal protein L31 [bacterium]
MKKNIHPKYFNKTKTTCICGAVYDFGSTKEIINVEICGNCHPFYTGNEKVLDTAGRIEKFKARVAAKVIKAPKISAKKTLKVSKTKTNK